MIQIVLGLGSSLTSCVKERYSIGKGPDSSYTDRTPLQGEQGKGDKVMVVCGRRGQAATTTSILFSLETLSLYVW